MNNFYSSERSETAEEAFQEFESGLKADVAAALSDSSGGTGRQAEDIGARMLLQAAMAYVRNPVHENELEIDQFGGVLQAIPIVYDLLLLGHHIDESDGESLSQLTAPTASQLAEPVAKGAKLLGRRLAERWEWAVLRSPNGSSLATSDTPARVFRIESGCMIWLWPITHNALFVAVSREHMEIRRRRLTVEEVTYVNSLIVAGTFMWAVSAQGFTNEQLHQIAGLWQKHEPITSTFKESGWYNAVPLLGLTAPGFLQQRLKI